jgi:glycosyltransferase involved in cell wall biosynthesis
MKPLQELPAMNARVMNATRPERPLRVMFVITSMPVGGAETLLTNLVQRLDPQQFRAEICCLKEPGPLGELLAKKFPVYSEMLTGKYDLRILGRLTKLMRWRGIDAVVTVGAGDKMFWGRLAAWRARVPVVLSALHSTGWPDGLGFLNRRLNRITDRFIAVADAHGRFLAEQEHLPADKVAVIPNGIDTQRFQPNSAERSRIRDQLGIDIEAPVFGLVAALRPEKNHLLFLDAAKLVQQTVPDARFLIVGDGPERDRIKATIDRLDLSQQVHMLGQRSDIPEILAAMDTFVLTSDNEANPVSILEALATELPVIATRVGSVAETVQEDITGFLVDAGDAVAVADRCIQLAHDRQMCELLGQNGRELVLSRWSLEQMVGGYEQLIRDIYLQKHPESLRIDLLPQLPADVLDADNTALPAGKENPIREYDPVV